ncbi:hypothetical protein BRC89_00405 [Halobacteriales archaeon QS_4_70_19]|nr:MAG: hypothetical protein BRC89_00405 [Halobacteriales archaeon QS_4_70_19]
MSATAAGTAETETELAADLTEKQRRIVDYLRTEADGTTYFKSRLVGEALDLSAKEVGANMRVVKEVAPFEIEKWGYSSGTTWKVTV